MGKGRRLLGAALAAALALAQLPVREADAAQAAASDDLSRENASARDGGEKTLGSVQIVGNRAMLLWNPGAPTVYSGENPPVRQKPPADFGAGKQEGGLPKYAVVDGSVVADQAFYQSRRLGAVELPEGIREIGEFAYARSSVTEVLIPAGVKEIGYGAFYHCDSLSEVTFLGAVENVAPKAFSCTPWVERFLSQGGEDGDFLIAGGVLAAYRGETETVLVPEGVEVIAAEVFKGHEEIVSLTLPESMRVVGEGAFEGCGGLTDIRLNQGLEKIKDRAFYGCGAARVTVPDTVKEEGLLAFEGISATYEGERPKQTWEPSACRLSNEAYRGAPPDPASVAAGVVVEEPEGGSAVLEGASRLYTLRASQTSDREEAERAFLRIFGRELPPESAVYGLELTDASGVPLTRLGRQTLTVTLPLPKALAGKELRLFLLDRNGQLEEISVETAEEETAVFRFGVRFVSQIVLCPQEEAF